jgi:cyclophilin family peptidyl-prolyl cis-trans isomerase
VSIFRLAPIGLAACLLVACGGSTSDVKISDSTIAAATAPTVASDPGVPATVAGAAGAYGGGACIASDGSAAQQRTFAEAPKQCIDLAKTYIATMKTSRGTMVFELLANKAPITVNSFVNLARAKYYDGIYFHRVVPDFVLQAGDPGATTVEAIASAGAGGPGYEFVDELPAAGEYKVGSLAMANAGANTNGSQFFVISGANGTQLPPNYALFGQLTSDAANLETLNAIAGLAVSDGPPSEAVVIESLTVTEK